MTGRRRDPGAVASDRLTIRLTPAERAWLESRAREDRQTIAATLIALLRGAMGAPEPPAPASPPTTPLLAPRVDEAPARPAPSLADLVARLGGRR